MAFGELGSTSIQDKKGWYQLVAMAITKKKRIVVLLLTTAILAPFLIFCWVHFSENTFVLIVLGVIFVGTLLEYLGKMLEKKNSTD